MAKAKTPHDEMSFLDHLEDLRWHLIRATLAIVIAGFIAFLAKGFIFDVLLFGPRYADFWTYDILCRISTAMGIDGGFCFDEMPFRIQSRTMGGQFSAHVWVAITAGFIISFPYVIYEFWKFVAPAMKDNEKKNARGFILISSVLFFLGVLFGYYVVTPLSINFLGKYQVSDDVFNDFDLASYISLVRASVIASGIIFELPIIMYFLTKVGIVTPDFLIKYRKYALVIVLILSAIITPPDIVSQIIVAIPVLILYEVSIIISKIVFKREEKKLRRTEIRKK
ncbi:twin-arginine translocase subunit TatC [Antarcticibacterium flavum]|uniref:Sec-independent protein translocase protein TatC n=1 Tax=Antarcticibacterium flavum TaxID=2058175 RepID=A0A5B7X7B8_9FLAO|nr:MULTISPECIES: twin-arginine translocase subunit TatC [Antarcticibacterium]MCM4161799.1 twin-arginine translocase subunit TatC [Antarcticibacterium sp. W02-3]QCY70608.1 twin-arginine translocase subunit TatC [Antarcticibacterium flavum]